MRGVRQSGNAALIDGLTEIGSGMCTPLTGPHSRITATRNTSGGSIVLVRPAFAEFLATPTSSFKATRIASRRSFVHKQVYPYLAMVDVTFSDDLAGVGGKGCMRIAW
jgi:hypothetical protein